MKASKSSTKRFCIVSVLILALAAVVALPMLASAADVKDTDAMGGEPNDILVSSNPDDTNQSGTEPGATNRGGTELGGAEGETGVLPNGSVTSVALDATSDTLRVGSSRALTVTVSPDDATDKTVKWSTENNDDVIELYSDSGLTSLIDSDEPYAPGTIYVKALKQGNATVVVMSESNPELTAQCTITVVPASGKHKVKVTVEGDGTAQASVSEAASGDKVTLTSKAGSFCLLKEWQVVSGGVTVSDDSFTMGDQDVRVKAVFIECNVSTQITHTASAYDHADDIVTLRLAKEELRGRLEDLIGNGELTDEEAEALKNGASIGLNAKLTAKDPYAEKWATALGYDPSTAQGTGRERGVEIIEGLDQAAQRKSERIQQRLLKKYGAQAKATPASATDVTLELKVDGCEARQITDTGEPITLEADIPENLQNTDPGVERTFYMIRDHDDELAVVGKSEPNATTLTGSSNLFSMYTVVYVDVPTGTRGTAEGDADTKASPKLANAGDPLPAAFLAAMALISAAAAVGVRRFSLR